MNAATASHLVVDLNKTANRPGSPRPATWSV